MRRWPIEQRDRRLLRQSANCGDDGLFADRVRFGDRLAFCDFRERRRQHQPLPAHILFRPKADVLDSCRPSLWHSVPGHRRMQDFRGDIAPSRPPTRLHCADVQSDREVEPNTCRAIVSEICRAFAASFEGQRSCSCVFITIGPYQATGSCTVARNQQESDAIVAGVNFYFVAAVKQNQRAVVGFDRWRGVRPLHAFCRNRRRLDALQNLPDPAKT